MSGLKLCINDVIQLGRDDPWEPVDGEESWRKHRSNPACDRYLLSPVEGDHFSH